MQTYVKDLVEEQDKIIQHQDPYLDALDASLPADVSVKALEKYYNEVQYNAIDLLNKIIGMYIFSGVRSLEKRLILIVTSSSLPIIYKLQASQALVEKKSDSDEQNIGYDTLDIVCNSFYDENTLSVTLKIAAIYLLMNSATHKEKALEYFIYIINNQEYDCEYRYKLILSIETKVKENSEWYIKRACNTFLFLPKNRTQYRILAAQYLLASKDKDKEEAIFPIIDLLLSFSQDNELDYNLRADATDVVLKFGSLDEKTIAKEIILMLGNNKKQAINVYQNSQNIHNEKIEKSIIEIIEFLSTVKVPEYMTFDAVSDDLRRFVEVEDGPNLIDISLNRIQMDRALYSQFNFSLRHIIVRVFAVIENTENIEEKKVLRTRLDQELNEMAGTCSTGFAGRLCNVLSGFHGINMKISWEDQIIANFGARMNTRINNIEKILNPNQKHTIFMIYCSEIELKCPDSESEDLLIDVAISEFKTNVLVEMTIDPSHCIERTHYIMFIRMMFSQVREELAKEFEQHIDSADFDLYFRKAIAHYEGQ